MVTLADIINQWLQENYVGLRVTKTSDRTGYLHPTIVAEGKWSGGVGMVGVGMVECDGISNYDPERIRTGENPRVFIYGATESTAYGAINSNKSNDCVLYPTDPEFFTKLKFAIDQRLQRSPNSSKILW